MRLRLVIILCVWICLLTKCTKQIHLAYCIKQIEELRTIIKPWESQISYSFFFEKKKEI